MTNLSNISIFDCLLVLSLTPIINPYDFILLLQFAGSKEQEEPNSKHGNGVHEGDFWFSRNGKQGRRIREQFG